MWILRCKGGVTAKRLARELHCGYSRNPWMIPDDEQLIINYGSGYRGDEMLNGNIITDKLEVSHILQENGIRTPRVYDRDEEIPDDVFPLLARKRHHSQGKDIVYVHNQEQLEQMGYQYDYLIRYINKKSEYRVHILGDYDALVTVKIPDKDERYSDPIVRSKNNGWIQVSYDRDFYDDLVDLGHQVIKVLGYDFGAVDIIRRKDRLYVLEVNSAPGLEPKKIAKYAEYFRWEKERREK